MPLIPPGYNLTTLKTALGIDSTAAQTLSSAGVVTLNLSAGSIQLVTLGANATNLAFSNVPAGASTVEIHFIQDGTGSRTLAAVPASVRFSGGTVPTLTTTAGKRDIFRFRQVSGVFYEIGRTTNVS